MVRCTPPTIIFLLWFLCVGLLNQSLCSTNSKVAACDGRDREVLLQFKRSIVDPSELLSSWSTQEDCCRWSGVQCHNITGRVTKLNLTNPYNDPNHTAKRLTGEINLCVLELEFLNYLDLSWNSFTTVHYSDHDGQGNQNLSQVTTPHSSALLHLDFSYNDYLQMDNFRWLSLVPSLRYLALSGSNLTNVTDWFQSIATMLPSISELRLMNCELQHQIPSIGYANFTSLMVLDLSYNFPQMENLRWLPHVPSLTYLDLSGNNLSPATDWLHTLTIKLPNLKSLYFSGNNLNGTIPERLGQFKHLQELDLSYNSFQGLIPPTLGNISSLIYLDVSHNKLNGSLPENMGQLANLETLHVAGNSLAGVLSEIHFSKLSNLKVLDLSSSAFQFQLGSQWTPPFQLRELYLGSCLLGPKFPTWVYSQNTLEVLDISSSGILSINHQDNFWSFILNISDAVNLSNNSISGDISTRIIKSLFIDISSNNISGGLPRLTPNVWYFRIGNNSFSGPTSTLLCDTINGEEYWLRYMDMSHNHLSGELPNCWVNWQYLFYINLGGNNLTGKIPYSLGSLSQLESLNLPNNNFSGDVPLQLQNCKRLVELDLGENKLSGSIPGWMGQNMGIIKLKSNQFIGNIPSEICQISSLIILDIAENKLFGPIPQCLHNISFMSKKNLFKSYVTSYGSETLYEYSVELLNKGQELEYQEILPFVRLVDLSSNNLSGTIPPELFGLSQLNILNLSHNHLLGRIPQEIGHMKLLESLDLSKNQLSGEIPQAITGLSFLSYLDLSYNNLSGQIPSATQLQSFSALSYDGNPELCGPPLTNNCTQWEGIDETNYIGEDDNQSELLSYFYIGMGVGFAIGFWGVCAMIFFNKACRHAYFIFLDHVKDQFISWCT